MSTRAFNRPSVTDLKVYRILSRFIDADEEMAKFECRRIPLGSFGMEHFVRLEFGSNKVKFVVVNTDPDLMSANFMELDANTAYRLVQAEVEQGSMNLVSCQIVSIDGAKGSPFKFMVTCNKNAWNFEVDSLGNVTKDQINT